MAEPAVTGARVSFAAYLRLPDELHAEFVDGHVMTPPPPSYPHQKVCQRLTRLLEDTLGGHLDVVAGAGFESRPGSRVRIPDVMVLEHPPSGPLVRTAPVVAVEVLSTNRTDDLVRKSGEYLEAGVRQYWVVDPRDRVLDAFEAFDVADAGDGTTGWTLVTHLDDDHPHGQVTLPDGTTVVLDLAAVLG